jgi:hypothetical protein
MNANVADSASRIQQNDLPQYVRKFRLESAEIEHAESQLKVPTPFNKPALIWTKVVLMSAASTGLLYLTVLVIR